MVWIGVIVLLAGAVPAFAVGGDIGGVDATVAGAVTMVLGAALLIAGILRLNRARRRARMSPAARAAATRDYKTGTAKIITMIAAVVYIVSPLDIVPDVLLPVGVVDDAGALTWLLFALGQEYTRHARKRRALSRD